MDFQAQIYKAGLEKLHSLSFPNAELLAKFMVVQSQHETGNYTSHVFKANNNAFGYKFYPGSSYQKAGGVTSPEGDPYAVYGSVSDSAREVAAWIGRRKDKFVSVKTVDQYVHTLKTAGYFGDKESNYLADVKRYLATFTTPQLVGIGLIPVVGLGLLVYHFMSK